MDGMYAISRIVEYGRQAGQRGSVCKHPEPFLWGLVKDEGYQTFAPD